ncbi:MAG: hypothetical protein DHS20C21_03130 [Gemmatimonadota bacterium]|nr:MAG: hypothetical protein DHS20C21_03130 [Gemmatimonadota bacterium]
MEKHRAELARAAFQEFEAQFGRDHPLSRNLLLEFEHVDDQFVSWLDEVSALYHVSVGPVGINGSRSVTPVLVPEPTGHDLDVIRRAAFWALEFMWEVSATSADPNRSRIARCSGCELPFVTARGKPNASYCSGPCRQKAYQGRKRRKA